MRPWKHWPGRCLPPSIRREDVLRRRSLTLKETRSEQSRSYQPRARTPSNGAASTRKCLASFIQTTTDQVLAVKSVTAFPSHTHIEKSYLSKPKLITLRSAAFAFCLATYWKNTRRYKMRPISKPKLSGTLAYTVKIDIGHEGHVPDHVRPIRRRKFPYLKEIERNNRWKKLEAITQKSR